VKSIFFVEKFLAGELCAFLCLDDNYMNTEDIIFEYKKSPSSCERGDLEGLVGE